MRNARLVLACLVGAVVTIAPAFAQDARQATSQRPRPEDWPKLRSDRAALVQEITTLERDQPDLRDLEKTLALNQVNAKRIEEQLAEAKRTRPADVSRLEAQVTANKPVVEQLERNLQQARDDAQKLRTRHEELSKLDSRIGELLTVETLFQEFKTRVTVYFAGMVLIVVSMFVFIFWKDEFVRRTVFAGPAGLQFLTLFLLVVAIILFGVLGILEGKELAALLGGLSGYILGRVTMPSGPQSSGGAGVGGAGGAGGGGASGGGADRGAAGAAGAAAGGGGVAARSAGT